MAVTTFHFPLDFLWSIAFPQELVTPAEPHAGGRRTYDEVRPGIPKGLFATQPCSFRTMPYTLAVVDQSPIHCLSMCPPPPRTRMPRTGFWRLFGIVKVVYYLNTRIHKDW
jgi:hypothetical protein